MSATIERRFHLGTARGRGGGSCRTIERIPAPVPEPERTRDDPDRIHPLARRMAIRCQQLIDSGVVADQASLAAVAGMTRAWITVVMRLNLLAPDIQEEILNLDTAAQVDHRAVQEITKLAPWSAQRAAWREINLR